MNKIIWDAFISHASEDKNEVVLPLSKLLLDEGLKIWLDQGEIFLGDSLREKIDEGLSFSQFGIIILSHNFFNKNWTIAELDALFSREISGEKVILPIWHGIGVDEIRSYSPLLAGKYAVSTDQGLNEVKEKILSAIYKEGRKESIGKPIYSGKLNKRAIMTLPEGSYLISNCYSPFDRKPLIEEMIEFGVDRNSFWEKVKSKGADGRLCHVFKEYEDYQAYKRSLNSLVNY
ncbi:toll/interleukin-1 receptor domain-containing protein [Acinetobacter chinensis]|uniref:Toll/interleukin-1 receptor domain-containing protein n=1 Tax=Acinetobacter chinensis TaxID=2004650 RepID=A0ABU3WIY0_9GAMM|nr:toll/interleukin-1 receptor domain-containing protein [Acinetobacter chinensis]MDV2470361.1 toll/interleukin-1 receptor domain-containing protein [Acinetobacter chinensis]